MTVPPAASLLQFLTGLVLAPAGEGPLNRCALEGLHWQTGDDGSFEVEVQTLEATALRFSLGPLALEIDRLVVHGLSARLRADGGGGGGGPGHGPGLSALEAGAVELSGVKLSGRLSDLAQWSALANTPARGQVATAAAAPTRSDAPAGRWCLGPLEEAEGAIHGTITDAQLLFDAKVTVPIRHGEINFNDSSVEHIGPDSRMGVSRLGLYVDAPTGRSYLYQFASAPLVGVAFEQRDALFGPWISERGRLWLKAFGEALLSRADTGQQQGLTAQARLLLGRTALSGQLQLGDASFALAGLQGRTEGSAQGGNRVALTSKSVGEGLQVALAALSLRDLAARSGGLHLRCDAISGGVVFDLHAAEPDMRFSLALQELRLARPRAEA